MTDEQKELYERIKATGRLNEEQLERLKKGFEKKPRKYDLKKSQLHTDMVALCQKIENRATNTAVGVDWQPENEDGDAYIYIMVENFGSLGGKDKSDLTKAINNADVVTFSTNQTEEGEDFVVITLGFMDIIHDPNKPDNMTAN